MKKTNLVSLLLLIGFMFLLGGCSTTSLIPRELIIQPTPDNPIEGTWIDRTYGSELYIIEGVNGTLYQFIRGGNFMASWTKIDNFIIEKKGDEYVISSINPNIDNIKMKLNGDILYIGNTTYKRVNK